MTTVRFGFAFIVLGIAFIVAGALGWANDNLAHIGGVGLIVQGAVAVCIATESANGRPPEG